MDHWTVISPQVFGRDVSLKVWVRIPPRIQVNFRVPPKSFDAPRDPTPSGGQEYRSIRSLINLSQSIELNR